MCIIIIIIISTGYCGLLVGVACDPRHCGSYPGLDDHTHLIKVFINCKLVHTHTRIVGVVRVWFTIFIGGIALFEYCIVAVQKLILSEIISLCSRMAGTCNKFLIHLIIE